MWKFVCVCAAVNTNSQSCSSLRWTAAYKRMTQGLKGCYWLGLHTHILWCPRTHSCEVETSKVGYAWLCSRCSLHSSFKGTLWILHIGSFIHSFSLSFPDHIANLNLPYHLFAWNYYTYILSWSLYWVYWLMMCAVISFKKGKGEHASQL